MVRDLIEAERRLVRGLSPAERHRRLYLGKASDWDEMLSALTIHQTGCLLFAWVSNSFMRKLWLADEQGIRRHSGVQQRHLQENKRQRLTSDQTGLVYEPENKKQRLRYMAKHFPPAPPEPLGSEKLEFLQQEKGSELRAQYRMKAEDRDVHVAVECKRKTVALRDARAQEELLRQKFGFNRWTVTCEEGHITYYYNDQPYASYSYNDPNYPPKRRMLIQVKDRSRPEGCAVLFNIHKKLRLGVVLSKYSSLIDVVTGELQFMALDRSRCSNSGALELQSIGPDDTAETNGMEHGDVISAMRASVSSAHRARALRLTVRT